MKKTLKSHSVSSLLLLLSLLFLLCSGCGPIFVPPRILTPNVEKKGDIQIDLDTLYQGSAMYALTDSFFLSGSGRYTSSVDSSSYGDLEFADKNVQKGGSLGMGYQSRLKGNPLIKYGFMSGLALESWSGQESSEDYSEEETTVKVSTFDTMLAIPYAQVFMGYGGRNTYFQVGVRSSYIQPFSSKIDDDLIFDRSLLVEFAGHLQVHLFDRLSGFLHFSLHGHGTQLNENNSYSVLPYNGYLGFSYALGSKGTIKDFDAKKKPFNSSKTDTFVNRDKETETDKNKETDTNKETKE